MGLFFERGAGDGASLGDIVPTRSASAQPSMGTPDSAMRHSGVWAGLRVRADLISSLPVDLYRKSAGVNIEVKKPEVLVKPGALFVGGERADINEWLWATQVDLDRYGNCFGRIIEWDGLYRPSRIDLLETSAVTVRVRDGQVAYLYRGKELPAGEVWHERQYPVAGLAVGLSPIAYAALTLEQYASAQAFALAWFNGTSHPSGKLRNKRRRMTPKQARIAKDRFRATQQAGDVLVLGNDWDYEMSAVPEATAQFIEAQKWSITDSARFIGVPADVIDAAVSGQNMTYANVTQRFLQLLVVNLGAPIQRREKALGRLVSGSQQVKLNSDALLRMDPETAARVLGIEIDHRVTTLREARALKDRPPLTPEDIGEFHAAFGDPNRKPTQPGGTP